MEDDRNPFCIAHIPMVTKLTEIQTVQTIQIATQKEMNTKLDDIKLSIAQMQMNAVKNQMATSAEIAKDRIKIGPVYWGVAISGTAIISAIVHWLGKTLFK